MNRFLAIICFIAFLLFAGQSGRAYDVTAAGPLPSDSGDDLYVFLPLMARPPIPRGIYGYLTLASYPFAGISLQLRFYDGSVWSTLATTTTDSDGMYSFLNVPSLQPGQRYYVRYLNPTYEQGYVRTWLTPLLTAYTAGTEVHLSDFDITAVPFYEPGCTCTLTLPYTFKWVPRATTPSDNYEFDVYDWTDGNPYFYSPPLGYVGSYTLSSLPPGFSYNTWYVIEIWIYSPDGGVGISNFQSIMFGSTSVPSALPGPVVMPWPVYEPKPIGDEVSWRALLRGQNALPPDQ